QQVAQAKADLREIVNDALGDLRAVEPDATLEERGTTRSSFVATPSFTLTAGGVRLRIDPWEGMTTDQPVPGDTMVLAGCVVITNPSYSTELNSANLVCEQVGDRLAWQIYKFRSGLVPPDRYSYGPYGRTHGLRHGEFFNPRERSHVVRQSCWTTRSPTPRSALRAADGADQRADRPCAEQARRNRVYLVTAVLPYLPP
ncbi:MAG: hypothetical protein ACRDOE_24435, partial [Streptosporangiaceae bacterium]